MTERENGLDNFVSRHETGLVTTLVIGSPIYISILNRTIGLNGNLDNPAGWVEVGIVTVTAAFCGAAIVMGEKPSQVIKDIIRLGQTVFSKK